MTILPVWQKNRQRSGFVPLGTAAVALFSKSENALRLKIFLAFIQYD
jgi:hypothetical protein